MEDRARSKFFDVCSREDTLLSVTIPSCPPFRVCLGNNLDQITGVEWKIVWILAFPVPKCSAFWHDTSIWTGGHAKTGRLFRQGDDGRALVNTGKSCQDKLAIWFRDLFMSDEKFDVLPCLRDDVDNGRGWLGHG